MAAACAPAPGKQPHRPPIGAVIIAIGLVTAAMAFIRHADSEPSGPLAGSGAEHDANRILHPRPPAVTIGGTPPPPPPVPAAQPEAAAPVRR